jgi:hypothetical protein
MHTLTATSRLLTSITRANPRQFTRSLVSIKPRPDIKTSYGGIKPHVPIPRQDIPSNTTTFPFLSAAILASLCVITKSAVSNSDSDTPTLYNVSALDQQAYNAFTKNGTDKVAATLIESFFELNIPPTKQAFMFEKFNAFLKQIDTHVTEDSQKKRVVHTFIKGYSHFFNHYAKFPPKLKQLFDSPKIMEACNSQLYHITGVTIPGKSIADGVLYHKTSPTKEALDGYQFYKSSVKKLTDSGITSLDGGRGTVHIPWSLAASKIVMSCIEKAKEDALEDISTHYVGEVRHQKTRDLNQLFEKHIDTLSNCILHLVFWAVTVDDVPDKMSKEMPKKMNQALLTAMKLISHVDTRKKFLLEHPDDIFTTREGELQKIKEVLQDIEDKEHRAAAEQYVEGAYLSFHNAWDSFSMIAELTSENKSVLIRDFGKIMTSFQHALDVNYDPKPFNIQKAEDVHYGMHMVVFYEMALASAEKIRASIDGTSFIQSHDDDFLEIFRRQSLLMQQMGSISNLICTGVSSQGDVSRELQDGDFSNQLICDAFELASEKKSTNSKGFDTLGSLLTKLTSLKEDKRNWFSRYGSLTGTLPEEALSQKCHIDRLWDTNVKALADTITDVLPDLFDNWFSLYVKLDNYDENQEMSDSAIVFLFQNIAVKGKL